MINRKSTFITFLIFILLNPVILTNYSAFHEVSAQATESEPPILHWRELWEDFEPEDCKLPDFDKWETINFRDDPTLSYNNKPPVVKAAAGLKTESYSGKLRLKYGLFAFFIYETEEAAKSVFSRKDTGIVEQILDTEFSVWEGYGGIAESLFVQTITKGEFELWATPPDVEPDFWLPLDDFFEYSLGPKTWHEDKIVTDGEGEEKKEIPVFRQVGGHTEIVVERYKTAVIWNLGWTGVMTKWYQSYVGDVIDEDEIEVPIMALNAQARKVVDSRVRILRFNQDSWFGWGSDKPLFIKVSVEEKLPLGGEIGLASETRFGEWTWQTPREPVKISLRMFRYDLKANPSSEKWANLIDAYGYYRQWVWQDPVELPKINVGGKDEYCLIFDTTGILWPKIEISDIPDVISLKYNPDEIDTSDKGYTYIDSSVNIMLRKPLEEKNPVLWSLNKFTDFFRPTIVYDSQNRYGDIGATVQAAAYHINKDDKKIVFCESGLEQIKITHVGEVVSTSKSMKNTFGINIHGYIKEDWEWTWLKRYGSIQDDKIKPWFGTESYNLDGYQTKFQLMPLDGVELGRHDTIVTWYPLLQKMFKVSTDSDAMKDKQTAKFLIYPTSEGLNEIRESYKNIVIIGTTGIAALAASPMLARSGWISGAIFPLFVGAVAWGTKELLEKIDPEELIWTDVTFEGTVIGLIYESNVIKLYVIDGKVTLKDFKGNEEDLLKNQMIQISRDTPTLSPIEYFDNETLPSSLQSMITEDLFDVETIIDIDPEPEPEPKPETEPGEETWASEWTVVQCLEDRVEWHEEPGTIWGGAIIHTGRAGMLMFHPSYNEPAILRTINPFTLGENPYLNLGISAPKNAGADFLLTVNADGEPVVKDKLITSSDGWLDLSYDLSKYALKTIPIEIVVSANSWWFEHCFIDYIEITSGSNTSTTPIPISCGIENALLWSDFEEGTAHDYGNEVGDWEIATVSGYSKMYTATTNSFRFSTIGDLDWHDYVVEADFIKAKNGGLLLRAQNHDNCIALIVRPEFNDIYWHVRKGGGWGAALERAILDHTLGEDLHVKVEVEGNKFKAYINGELKTSFETAEFPKGKIGLYLYYSPDQYWDNIAVCGEGEQLKPTTIEKSTETKVYIKDYAKNSGSKVSIPVYIEKAENLGNMDFSLSFDDRILKATGYEKGSLTSGSLLEAKIEGNTMKAAFTDSQGLNGDGTIIYIDFTVVGSEGARCSMTPSVTNANEVETHKPLTVSTESGTFAVQGLTGDANGDGRITAVDALMALKMAVGTLPVDLICDINGDGLVTSLDATLIREKAVEL